MDGQVNYLSLPQVLAKLPVSKAMLYKLIATQNFPRPIKIGTRSVWVESAVDTWVATQSQAVRS